MAESNWLKNVINLQPYIPGEQSEDKDIIKLNANENPYPPAPGVGKAIKSFRISDLNKYPERNPNRLNNLLSLYHDCDKNNVHIGNGSDELLALAFRAFFNSRKPVLFSEITYTFYPVWCDLFDIPYEQVPLTDDMHMDFQAYNKENGGIVLANPNATTGISENPDHIRNLLESNPDSVVIVDEAYGDFTDKSVINLIDKYDNLLVVKTFSKARALAGIRLGYCIGSKSIIDIMRSATDSFNSYPVNQLTIEAGLASVEDEDYLKDSVAKINKTKAYLIDQLSVLGFNTIESDGNFILTYNDSIDAYELYEYLKENSIYVRYFDSQLLNNRLRISIGTDEQMNLLIDAVKRYIKED